MTGTGHTTRDWETTGTGHATGNGAYDRDGACDWDWTYNQGLETTGNGHTTLNQSKAFELRYQTLSFRKSADSACVG